MLEKRSASLLKRQIANGHTPQRRDISSMTGESAIRKWETLDAVWGPYAVDEEVFRHDIREEENGVDLYLDIGVIDVETCEPLENPYLTIWHCNATGTYGGFTGIDSSTASIKDGWTTRSDGTTDDETFLRGIISTDSEGIAEFLTVFPGYYITRSTHIHLTVQTNVSSSAAADTSYSTAGTKDVGQLFFNETLTNQVYELNHYNAHLSTLNRTLNEEDSVYITANTGGYSAEISVNLLGDTIADGIVGYITVGINSTAADMINIGGSNNSIGVIPTISVESAFRAAATDVDIAAGYGNWALFLSRVD